MESRYKILIGLFAAVVAVSLAGFYRSYISHFPDLDHFSAFIHVHFVVFLSWFVFILLQPLLIYKEQYVLHRKIGKLSYFLAPLMIITILLVARGKIVRELSDPDADPSITTLVALLDVISFSACYLIAMIKRSDLRWHVAFIIGGTLIVLNPGMSRLLNNVQPGLGLLAAVLLPFIVSISIIVFEKVRFERSMIKSPYFVFLLLWTFEIVLFISMPRTELWQTIFAAIVGIL